MPEGKGKQFIIVEIEEASELIEHYIGNQRCLFSGAQHAHYQSERHSHLMFVVTRLGVVELPEADLTGVRNCFIKVRDGSRQWNFYRLEKADVSKHDAKLDSLRMCGLTLSFPVR